MKSIAALAIFVFTAHAADPLYESTQHKLDAIQNRKIPRGSAVKFTAAEINAWARVKVPEVVPEGIRDERVEFGEGTATGYAIADFLKMRQAKGKETNWLMARLLEGERPLAVTVRLDSGGGRCVVHLVQVQIGDAVATGTVLDFLIKTFFLPLYPDAKIDQPFDLDFDMDSIDIKPSGVVVRIKK
jgi:hypothetical protein